MKNQNKTILIKGFSFLLILLLAFSFLGKVNYTYAFFSDTATTSENTFFAGTLELSLRSGQSNFVPPEIAGNMEPGDSVARDIYIKNIGTLSFRYRAESLPENDNCDLDFYNLLELRVWYNWHDGTGKNMSLKYNGLLKDFEMNFDGNDSDLRIPNDHSYFNNNFYEENEHWLYFSINYPEDEEKKEGLQCKFDFVFNAWQENIPYGQGFSDTESISNVLTDSIPEEQEDNENNDDTGDDPLLLEEDNGSADSGNESEEGNGANEDGEESEDNEEGEDSESGEEGLGGNNGGGGNGENGSDSDGDGDDTGNDHDNDDDTDEGDDNDNDDDDDDSVDVYDDNGQADTPADLDDDDLNDDDEDDDDIDDDDDSPLDPEQTGDGDDDAPEQPEEPEE